MKIAQKNRKIGYTYNSVSGRFSFRGEKTIEFESTLERDLLTSLEFDENVSEVIEQPVTIKYKNSNGRNVSYTPDFLVHYKKTNDSLAKPSLLIEVKPNFILKKKWSIFKPKFKIGIKYAKQEKYIFKIYDESRLHTQYFDNITFLCRYKKFNYSEDEKNKILKHLNIVGSTQIDHLILKVSPTKQMQDISLIHIRNLLSLKVLSCDMDKILNDKSVIWVNDI